MDRSDPWPLYLTRGDGARVWDVDGNEYLDFHNGFSAMVQGHAHPAIVAAVQGQVTRGTHFGATTELTVAVAEELTRRFGRSGSVAHHGSGEIFIAFSTTGRAVRGEARPQDVAESRLDSLFQATVEATEEAVMNALWRAETTTGRMGRVVERLPHEPVLELLESHGRLSG